MYKFYSLGFFMNKKLTLVFLFLVFLFMPSLKGLDLFKKANTPYPFKPEPIDVVIPAIAKDLRTLDLCIEGITANGSDVRKIYVVSPEKLTDKAEWVDEKSYPFTKYDVALHLCQMDEERAKQFLNEKPNWVGWYYQQLLKLYAPFVIPDISSNVLILDSDTIFLKPVKFLTPKGAGLYNPGKLCVESYFVHARKMLPGFKRLNKKYAGICHHMLYQKPVLLDLFKKTEHYHKRPFWKAFCLSTNTNNLCTQGASEYEIYFNYVFARTPQVKLRFLKHADCWTNAPEIKDLNYYRKKGYDYASFHMVQREK